MANRVVLEPAYVLHRRPYSNTSLIVEFFTEKYGRMAAVARSARGLKSRYRGKLELFFPMMISWSGRGELKTLGQVEFSHSPITLGGNPLLCGFYLNEMLMRLLHRDDPYTKLFHFYHETLQKLKSKQELQVVLRLFEKHLLHELGYGLSFVHEHQTKNPIDANAYYQFIPDRGFIRAENNTGDIGVFCGASLLAFHAEQFSDKPTLQDAKRLMRLAFSRHLGDRPLKSRELLQ